MEEALHSSVLTLFCFHGYYSSAHLSQSLMHRHKPAVVPIRFSMSCLAPLTTKLYIEHTHQSGTRKSNQDRLDLYARSSFFMLFWLATVFGTHAAPAKERVNFRFEISRDPHLNQTRHCCPVSLQPDASAEQCRKVDRVWSDLHNALLALGRFCAD